ncbi:glycogen/starch/alpha-glucan phosphorylase [Bifidobacterium psychraerophilum]|uniref:Alpha-1,4 glucan phosphorylase n=1 Tax=Bifidobacterium psychraerophilum TaxID=218140 RepID=A0A087CHT4_9BIFI|nr:glycogen/starch/alpha-glucan phosphorylase [Bifidobacterium psychraerophilum]KFI82834.1 glycogen phosphorylase [Bifidobacterium psychraerophilum]PKA94582.1 starch phosphorylase [Bifidobacterium psychraerophilum DSM 22366]
MTEVTAPKASLSGSEFAGEIRSKLKYQLGVDESSAKASDVYVAVASAVRDHLSDSWMRTRAEMVQGNTKAVGYLSAEFLIGRQLSNALLNVGLDEQFALAMKELGFDQDEVIAAEAEPGLGNGGLGRLAACYVDSLASLGVPAFGYGIRYRYGIFRQEFDKAGRQVEKPDYWLTQEEPWGHVDYHRSQRVGFGGTVQEHDGAKVWEPAWSVRAVPVDYPVPGYESGRVNTLRLWESRSYDEFDLSAFNDSDYMGAVVPQVEAENITKILYPEDSTPQGKRLRLEQQYFFVAASIHDAIATFYPGQEHPDLRTFPEKICFQLNDTHPVIGIPELMRVLLDEYGYDWDTAWDITTRTFNYTCHTLLPEALEVWSAQLIGELLPRHLQIIDRIDAQFVEGLENKGLDGERIDRMRILTRDGNPQVRMAFLATVGGLHVNGVAELHSQLLRDVTLKDFSDVFPERFTNVTNGVTPRRFVRLANPRLSALISEGLGTDRWMSDLERLQGLAPLADDASFVERFAEVKRANKRDFSVFAQQRYGFEVDPGTMFDSMVKRLHEYKRQSLKILAVIAQYAAIKDGTAGDMLPRTVFFGAKAAPGYAMAKLTIRLINNVARVIDADPDVAGRLQVRFPENYNIELAEHLIPATELDEQISQAGKEASGTGNMKFALNGALTVGTLDGANVEIRERVGAENFFLFGLEVEDVDRLYAEGYDPLSYVQADPRLRKAVDMVAGGVFSEGDRDVYASLVSDWLTKDYFMTMADFTAYMDIQQEVEDAYRDQARWNRSAILNVANSGYFSSDRSIKDYLERIWHTSPSPSSI